VTCHVGEGSVVCTGRGAWDVGHVRCPWCCLRGDEPVRVLFTEVFGGWCGRDYICGNCGQAWSSDADRLTNVPDEEREANKARVAAVPDPACFRCQDRGEIWSPIAEEPEACGCAASTRKEAK
jgi:hypothetical protein